MDNPHLDPHALRARVRRDAYGFVTPDDVAALAGHETARLWQLLVRCHGCRFLCAAQDVAHLIRCIEAGGDVVRDVAFPALGDR